MKITLISALMIMLAYFLMLYGAVGFIQDKRLFSSAPKEYGDKIIGIYIIHFRVCFVTAYYFPPGLLTAFHINADRNGYAIK